MVNTFSKKVQRSFLETLVSITTRMYSSENTFQGVPVSAYADQLVGTKITGQRSGVSAYVDKILFPEDSERGQMTLYINIWMLVPQIKELLFSLMGANSM